VGVLQRLGIIPHQDQFFSLLEQQADNAHLGAQRLVELLEHFQDPEQGEKDLHDIEHRGDNLVHDLFNLLNESFITPIDREDLHALASRQDDIIDLVHEVSEHLTMYRIREIRPEALELARIIVTATDQLCRAMTSITAGREATRGYWVEVNRLENVGDQISKAAIGRLFDEEKDPLNVIKWKDIFDRLERAIDATEDVANVIEAVVLKNG
jgi:predicted phosphate transport protein (TIGR00153 family)